ncbi:MAG: PA domain-containing protein [Verrucomicrobiota bacterium]
MRVGVCLLFLLLWAGHGFGQFSVQYTDGAGEGFNATDARAPVGGNAGTTLGEQRRIALEAAVDKWEEFVEPNGPVVIEADFEVLSAGTLAQAGIGSAHIDFAGALEADTWYVAALANHLAGSDLSASTNEVLLTANSQIDAGSGYYYGLDSNAGGFQTDFFLTMLHEIGHGLGFFSLVNLTTGAEFLGSTDAFSQKLLDILSGRTWDQMTDAERQSSAVSGSAVVWDGRGSQLAAPSLVGTGSQLARVSCSPANSASVEFPAGTAVFGPSLDANGITGEVVLVDDGVAPTADACSEPFVNATELAGKIALIDRGVCFFTEKVTRAQNAGAIGVIVADNGPDRIIVMGGVDSGISIPSVFVSEAAGVALRQLPQGTLVNLRVTDLAGTWDGKPLMYTPSGLEPGSSVSHWDVGFEPSFLLEPVSADTGRNDPDLALTMLRDIGWTVKDVPFPSLDYALWEELRVTSLTGRDQDADGDEVVNFVEYAFGSDPEDGESIPSPICIEILSGEVEVTFRRTDQAVDLEYSVLESSNLTNFTSPVGGSGVVEEAGSEVVDETRNLGAASGSRFFRVEAEEQ